MTIETIVSICHAANAKATLLPLLPSCCRRTSKCATATTKNALLPSCRLHRQAGHCCRAAAAATSAATLPLPRYHCLQKKGILLTYFFFTRMVTAAHSNDGRNQLTCIEKGKQKNNNKIRQHDKTNPSFNSPSPFPLSNPFLLKQLPSRLSLPSIPTTAGNACGQPSPPPSSPQWRQRQRRFFTKPQTSSGGCV